MKIFVYKIILLLTFMLCAVIVFFYYDLHRYVEPVAIQNLLLDYGRVGALLYVLLVAFGSAVGVPRQLFGIAGGYVFGLGTGFMLLSVGLTFGCSIGFFTSRMFFQEYLQKCFGHRLERLERFLCQNPFMMAMVVRFAPLGNNASTNVIAGLTTIPALPFIGGSACGYLPQSLIFTLIGTGVAVNPLVHISLGVGLLAVAFVLGFFLYKHYLQTEPASPCS